MDTGGWVDGWVFVFLFLLVGGYLGKVAIFEGEVPLFTDVRYYLANNPRFLVHR